MKKTCVILLALLLALPLLAQKRKVQNRPYIDLRPVHFGISIGLNLQDVEIDNVGPTTITLADGTETPVSYVCDADIWNPGFSVGVLADLRLGQHFSLRVAPTMHFGSKRLLFRNLLIPADSDKPATATQDLKNTYLSVPVDLKFYAQRFNNYRPYMLAGVSPMLNLAGKEQSAVQLKHFDTMVEVGMGCDFYLPFFKLIPELKFCYSLTNSIDRDHLGELRNADLKGMGSSISGAHTKMVVLTLYFE